jgi:putative ABC transport system permease protein
MFRFAAQNLLSRPVRSLLALLGLTVAIMGMVGLFSIAVGIDDTVNRTFSRVPGLAVMQPGAPIPLFSRLPASWSDEIAAVKGVRVVRPEVWARAQIVEGRPTFSPPRLLFGVDIEQTVQLKKAVYRDDIVKGRFLTTADRGTFDCVISQQIAEAFQKNVGDTLRVDGYDFTIVGIYRCGSLLLDVAIVTDIAAVRKVSKFDANLVTSIYFEPDGTVSDKELIAVVQNTFRGRDVGTWTPAGLGSLVGGGPSDLLNAASKLLPLSGADSGATDSAASKNVEHANSAPSEKAAAEETVDVKSVSDWGEKIQQLSGELDIFLWLMTGIGVVIALLSILNTMLMSVAERMIEFGVLRANGWTSWDVLRLITWESALLGVAGGVSGCIFGWCAVQIINLSFPTKLHLYASPGLLLFSLVFSTILGMLGGVYPAYWAVRMSPMDAIRRG